MEYTTLDLTINRANGLKNVNLFLRMDVYAEISIVGDPREKSKQKTPVAKHGNTDPQFNHYMRFTIDEAAAQSNRLTLEIKLVSNRILGDKKIGTVHVPIKQLLDKGTSVNSVMYSVKTANGKEKGTVEFSYKFREKFAVHAPPQGYGYPPTPHPGYSYAPPQPCCAGGGDVALGVEAGLIGGLLVADLISDASSSSSYSSSSSSSYDAGYYAGFVDASVF